MSGPAPSEIALIELWDYIDAARLKQSEAHAAIIARRALNAATGVDMEELDIGGMSQEKVLALIKIIGLEATKDVLAQAGTTEKQAAQMGIAFKAVDTAAIADQLEALVAQLREQPMVETKRVDYGQVHTASPTGLTKKKAYNPATDPMAIGLGADQLKGNRR